MRVMIVDDHDLVRYGVRAALAADARIEIVGEAATASAALRCARRTLPDLAVVDLRLPDMSGEDLTRELVRTFPSISVIMLSTYLSEATVRSALDAGAAAYVTKAAGLPELVSAIERVMVGGLHAGTGSGPQIVNQLQKLTADRRGSPLTPTPQQERVLELVAEGHTYHEISDHLFISESTVRFHVQKLKGKFAARTTTELIAKAIRTGFIAPAVEAGAPPS